MDAESDRKLEGDEDINLDASLCKIPLNNWLPYRHLLGPTAPRRRLQCNQIGVGRLWQQKWHYYFII